MQNKTIKYKVICFITTLLQVLGIACATFLALKLSMDLGEMLWSNILSAIAAIKTAAAEVFGPGQAIPEPESDNNKKTELNLGEKNNAAQQENQIPRQLLPRGKILLEKSENCSTGFYRVEPHKLKKLNVKPVNWEGKHTIWKKKQFYNNLSKSIKQDRGRLEGSMTWYHSRQDNPFNFNVHRLQGAHQHVMRLVRAKAGDFTGVRPMFSNSPTERIVFQGSARVFRNYRRTVGKLPEFTMVHGRWVVVRFWETQ